MPPRYPLKSKCYNVLKESGHPRLHKRGCPDGDFSLTIKFLHLYYAAAFARADFLIFFLNIMIVKITAKRVMEKISMVMNTPQLSVR